MAAFFLIYLNLPSTSPMEPSDEGRTFFSPSSPYLAIFCSLLLGFGDACYSTQIYSLLGSTFTENASSAFALYKFLQSLAAAIGKLCFYFHQFLIKDFFYSRISPPVTVTT